LDKIRQVEDAYDLYHLFSFFIGQRVSLLAGVPASGTLLCKLSIAHGATSNGVGCDVIAIRKFVFVLDRLLADASLHCIDLSFDRLIARFC